MSSTVVRYSNRTTTTIQGTSLALVATAGQGYLHDEKVVSKVEFTLGTSSTATVSVSPGSGGMPQQFCYGGIDPQGTLPLTIAWTVSSSGTASLVLTVPSSSPDLYKARLELPDGKFINLEVEH